MRILAEICSLYPERNEALINAGTIALSKETSDFPGLGLTTDFRWSVVRTSQEHGILGPSGIADKNALRVEDSFHVGQKVLLYCNHSCITAAAHFVYFVVDDKDIVNDVWVPWKGW